jgi:type IV pilus assembly protein PilN
MMIRINLLPMRQVKKREASRQILVLFAGAVILTAALNFIWSSDLSSQSGRNQQRIAATRQRIGELERVIGEVNNINKRKTDIQEKLKALDQLRKGRTGPVRLMDALATAAPKKVWIKDFDEKGGAVKIAGSALSHEDVAEFMRALSGVVWTPKGMGRLVEQKRDSKTSRVELLSGQGTVEDFAVTDISPFFKGIDLKKAERVNKPGPGNSVSIVNFEIAASANYTA